ncbi:MmcQ/YjbR family DNA-binding protein [Allonocardiopsis opalescens]|uniref:MmcQ/YjbR family DNA-binding protein n=1 Tax=Allonocardiopsis opalescens TaxID=1144618 RepID=A0A2T0QAX2_9ACTN|nr:MmcQ/YjbR family DNA-binding protein [Allonocardiopsis opalescens]PRY00993.1 hypothetical protein CLV72_102626 [Allonocardiopsis opalescens]
MAADFELVRAVARELPGAEEGTSYGTPAFRVRGRGFVRMHDDGERLVVRTTMEERDLLHGHDPETFTVPEHYRAYPYVVVVLERADPDELRDLVVEAWRLRAPKRLRESYDAG